LTEKNGQQESLINCDRDAYLAYRQSLDNAEVEVSGRYDKWILTLSGGALGLTITFLEKIAPIPKTETVWLLTFSWIIFVVSILSALISLLTSQSAIREVRNCLDEGKDLKSSKCFSIITNILNWASALLFVLGAVCFCLFTLKNIPEKGKNYEQRHAKYSTKPIERRFCPTCATQYPWPCPVPATKADQSTGPAADSRDEEINKDPTNPMEPEMKQNNEQSKGVEKVQNGYVPPKPPTTTSEKKDPSKKK